MPSVMKDQRVHGREESSALNVCGGVLTLLVFLVPALLAAAYLNHATRMFSELVQDVAHTILLRGAVAC